MFSLMTGVRSCALPIVRAVARPAIEGPLPAAEPIYHPVTPNPETTKAAPRGGPSELAVGRYRHLILASLNRTCLRATGSYLRSSSFSVLVRGFFLVT